MKYSAIHSADSVFKIKMGVAYLFWPLRSSRVLRMKVRVHEMEGPNLSTFLAMAMLPHIVSVLRMLPVN